MPEPPAKKRILIVITTLGFGGAETQVVTLAGELARRGWTVGVACLLKPAAWSEHLEKQGVAVYSLEMKRGVPDLRAILRLRQLVKSFRPSIVHSHMVHANLLARITRLICPMPALVCTAHNLKETSEKGGPTWYKEVLYRLTDFLADRTTIICRAAFDRYVKVGAVPVAKLEVIPNGIDVQRFSPSPEARTAARGTLGIAASTFVWLSVGRLVEQKDYPTLLAAVRLMPDKDFVVMIAGKGALLESLQAECLRLGLDGKVKFLGASENVGQLYVASDAFVMSSVFEGLSAALLEASAMALPSVVTDVGGNTEIVTPGKTGYVVPAGNPVRLCEALKNMMALDDEQRQSLGEAARRHCLATYRLELVTDRWLELYARCLARTSLSARKTSAVVASSAAPQ
jgi:glycosyltransferase involved in cell wall biosynthesis